MCGSGHHTLQSGPRANKDCSSILLNVGCTLRNRGHLWDQRWLQLWWCWVYIHLQPTCWWWVAVVTPRLDSSSAGICSPPGFLLQYLKRKSRCGFSATVEALDSKEIISWYMPSLFKVGISGKLLNYIVKLKQGKAKRNVSQVFK